LGLRIWTTADCGLLIGAKSAIGNQHNPHRQLPIANLKSQSALTYRQTRSQQSSIINHQLN
jgi:hypothetical protein